jgi:hypothetical protein
LTIPVREDARFEAEVLLFGHYSSHRRFPPGEAPTYRVWRQGEHSTVAVDSCLPAPFSTGQDLLAFVVAYLT